MYGRNMCALSSIQTYAHIAFPMIVTKIKMKTSYTLYLKQQRWSEVSKRGQKEKKVKSKKNCGKTCI